MGNDNRYDMRQIKVKMTASVHASSDGRTILFRKKGSTQTGPAHFLNEWIANDWAKPVSFDNKDDETPGEGDKEG